MFKKIFKNIVSLSLIAIVLVVYLPLNVQEANAISDLKIYTGDQEFGNDTNMVIEFVVTTSVVAGNSGTLKIYFDADDNHSTGESILPSLCTTANGDSIFIYNVTDDVLHTTDGGNSYSTVFSLDGCGAGLMNLRWSNGVADDFTAGDVIRLYLGDSDDDGTGGYSGEYTKFVSGGTTVDGINNENLANPDAASGYDHVDVDVELETAGTTEKLSGSYPLVTNGGVVTMSGTNDPYLKMSLNQTAIDFGTLSTHSIASDDSLEITVETNAQSGYVLKYRATDFATADATPLVLSPFATTTNVVSGTEGWGINFRANTGAAGDAGVLGVAVSNTKGTGSLDGSYDTNDSFMIRTNSLFDTIASSSGLAHTTFTMSSVVGVSKNSPTGTFSTTLNFNVYGRF